MANNTIVSGKKKALLAIKQKIIEDIKYYEKRIEDFSAKSSSNCYIEDDASSESEDEFPVTKDLGVSVPQLKLDQSSLRTRLQATQELTNLQVLQSEVCVITTNPVLAGERPVLEPGTWREVTAECRVDLVPFSITFFTHQPNRQFAPTWYRGLRVTPVKALQEAELTKSVLPALVRPSDAVEIIRNYAQAYRSRRTTIARLTDKYTTLSIESMAEGGYIMKCGKLLEIAWRLENKWSPLAPFNHRMKFDLEYMDENYITKITQCHKQLSNPTLTTDERTLLLSKIISLCLEATVQDEHSESVDSDVETAKKVDKRRTTLDQEVDVPMIKKKKSYEVMAPPKYLPKKQRNKTNDNRVSKRFISENGGTVGKKSINNNNVTSDKNSLGDGDNVGSHINGRKNKESVASSENDLIQPSIDVSDKTDRVTESRAKSAKKTELIERVSDKEIDARTKNNKTNKKNGNSTKSPDDKVTQTNENKKVSPENSKLAEVQNKNKSKPKSVTNTKHTNVNDNPESGNTVRKSASKATDAKNNNDRVPKNINNKASTKITPVVPESDNNKEKSVVASKNNQDKEKNERTKDKNTVCSKNLKAQQIKNVESMNTVEKRKNIAIDKGKDHLDIFSQKKTSFTSAKKLGHVNSSNVANSKNNGHKEIDKVTDAKSIASAKNKITHNIKETQRTDLKNINSDQKSSKKSVLPLKSHNKPKDITNKITKTGSTTALNSGNIEKENGGTAKKSKIPQKKLSPVSESVLMKNPLRISPRKFASKFKSPSESNILTKKQKPSTNIPRLTKQVPKAK